jgi:hypothetical protein
MIYIPNNDQMLPGVLAVSLKQYCIGGQVLPNQNLLEAVFAFALCRLLLEN